MAKGRPNVEKLPPVAVTCAQERRATPEETNWVMNGLTKGLRLADWDEVPGTDSRGVEIRRDK